MENIFTDIIPILWGILITVVPVTLGVIIKVSKVKKEAAEAVQSAGALLLEIAEAIEVMASALADGKLTKEEAQSIVKEMKDVKIASSIFLGESKEFIAAFKEFIKKGK